MDFCLIIDVTYVWQIYSLTPNNDISLGVKRRHHSCFWCTIVDSYCWHWTRRILAVAEAGGKTKRRDETLLTGGWNASLHEPTMPNAITFSSSLHLTYSKPANLHQKTGPESLRRRCDPFQSKWRTSCMRPTSLPSRLSRLVCGEPVLSAVCRADSTGVLFQVCRSPLFHSSSLIPDRPTQFVFDGALPQSLTPQMARTDRRGSDSRAFQFYYILISLEWRLWRFFFKYTNVSIHHMVSPIHHLRQVVLKRLRLRRKPQGEARNHAGLQSYSFTWAACVKEITTSIG